jgi:type II secretory pathway pseudopilin PulG
MYDLGFGSNSLLSLALAALALLVGLWVWFLVNRASVRANEQVRLLQEIAEQQRQQTALLKSLAQSARGDSVIDDDDSQPGAGFQRFYPRALIKLSAGWRAPVYATRIA